MMNLIYSRLNNQFHRHRERRLKVARYYAMQYALRRVIGIPEYLKGTQELLQEFSSEPNREKKTPWPEFANELYRLSDCRLSAKLIFHYTQHVLTMERAVSCHPCKSTVNG
jgi:hypothetical protein